MWHSLNKMIGSLLDAGIEIRFMRDITRGGDCHHPGGDCLRSKFGIEIEEELLPIREQVNGLCEIYGFNPLYLANEGKVLMITSKESVSKAVEIMKQFDTGRDARIIGAVSSSNPGKVLMKSVTGGTRIDR